MMGARFKSCATLLMCFAIVHTVNTQSDNAVLEQEHNAVDDSYSIVENRNATSGDNTTEETTPDEKTETTNFSQRTVATNNTNDTGDTDDSHATSATSVDNRSSASSSPSAVLLSDYSGADKSSSTVNLTETSSVITPNITLENLLENQSTSDLPKTDQTKHGIEIEKSKMIDESLLARDEEGASEMDDEETSVATMMTDYNKNFTVFKGSSIDPLSTLAVQEDRDSDESDSGSPFDVFSPKPTWNDTNKMSIPDIEDDEILLYGNMTLWLKLDRNCSFDEKDADEFIDELFSALSSQINIDPDRLRLDSMDCEDFTVGLTLLNISKEELSILEEDIANMTFQFRNITYTITDISAKPFDDIDDYFYSDDARMETIFTIIYICIASFLGTIIILGLAGTVYCLTHRKRRRSFNLQDTKWADKKYRGRRHRGVQLTAMTRKTEPHLNFNTEDFVLTKIPRVAVIPRQNGADVNGSGRTTEAAANHANSAQRLGLPKNGCIIGVDNPAYQEDAMEMLDAMEMTNKSMYIPVADYDIVAKATAESEEEDDKVSL